VPALLNLVADIVPATENERRLRATLDAVAAVLVAGGRG
jgi:hypothetical protein